MNFDKVVNKVVGEEKVQYGFVFGNEKIVFIKSGAYGGIKSQDDKYLKMAYRVHDRLGATVICASNPEVEHIALDEKAIRFAVAKLNVTEFETYFVGISDGGYQNLLLARKFPETVKYLGINCSFIDLGGLEERIKKLSKVEKIFVYGTEDDDYDEVCPALKELEGDNLAVMEVKGANHKFTGKLNELVALMDLL